LDNGSGSECKDRGEGRRRSGSRRRLRGRSRNWRREKVLLDPAHGTSSGSILADHRWHLEVVTTAQIEKTILRTSQFVDIGRNNHAPSKP